MRKTIYLLLISSMVVLGLGSCKNNRTANKTGEAMMAVVSDKKADTLKIDLANSSIQWQGYKPGGQHNGDLKLKSGEVYIVPADSSLVGGRFVMDMNTINCLDLDEKGGKGKLEAHLKSVDFFDVAKYPEGIFEITSVEQLPEEGCFRVTGNLTLKETTLSIAFEIRAKRDGRVFAAASDSITLDRTLWGVNYGSKNVFKNLKDNLIDEHIDIQVNLFTE